MEDQNIQTGFSKEFIIVLLLVIITFFFFIHETNQVDINQIYFDAKELDRKNKFLKERIKLVKQEIEMLEKEQGIEMLARKKLRLIKPGEIIIKEHRCSSEINLNTGQFTNNKNNIQE